MQARLKAQLAEVIKQQPKQFTEVIFSSYGGVMPAYVAEVINCVHRENLGLLFKAWFNAKNPGLSEGMSLICRFINPGIKEEEIAASLSAFKETAAQILKPTYDVFYKAELLQSLIFNKLGFKVENLNADAKILSLPDIIKRRKTSGFAMAVLYLLLADTFDTKADITDVAGKAVVRLRDTVSSEPVYIDITSSGQFVSEEECHAYAATRGMKWDSSGIKPLENKQIIKRLISNLIYVYSRSSAESENNTNLNFLRQYLAYAQ